MRVTRANLVEHPELVRFALAGGCWHTTIGIG